MVDHTGGNDPNEWLDLDQVAEELDVSRVSVKRLIYDGELPALKIGNRRKVERHALDEYIERIRTAAQEEQETRSRRRRPGNGFGHRLHAV